MLYMTDYSTASKMLNLNSSTQGTQCGVKDNTITQRRGEKRHRERLIKISHMQHKSESYG